MSVDFRWRTWVKLNNLMEDNNNKLREKFASEAGPADWKALRAHYERGAVFIATADIDLIDVALRIAEDDIASVEKWVRDGKLVRPTPKDAKRWEEKGPELTALIVSPFVLVQEILPH